MTAYEFQPGDGSLYSIQLFEGQYGGTFVINHEESIWRWHKGNCLVFLMGNDNKFTKQAIWEFLEALE